MKYEKRLLICTSLLLFSDILTASETPYEHQPEVLCAQAQSLLGSYPLEKITSLTNFTLHENVDSFVQSKPKIEDNKLYLQGYLPTISQARSEYGQLWCKLKNVDDLKRSSLDLPAQGAKHNCDEINKFFFEQTLSSSENLKQAYLESGYKVSFKNTTYYTGAQWAPSYPTIQLLTPKEILINTTSLESLSGIPVIGGMNYCKFVSPEGLRKFIEDISQEPTPDLDKISLSSAALPENIVDASLDYQKVNIEEDHQLLTRHADFYWPKTSPVGIIIISPGGGIQPLHMRSLAKILAHEGHGVIVVEYPANLAVFEKIIGRRNTAYLYATLIKNKEISKIKDLNPRIAADLSHLNLPIRLLGHSLGGAVMGDSIFGKDHIFDQIILYGTLSFIQSDNSSEITAANVQILFGENDGLSFSDPKSFDSFIKKYKFEEVSPRKEYRIANKLHSVQIIPNLNHFCIINDMTAGLGLLRDRDKIGPSPSQCVTEFKEYLKNHGLLSGK
jgi:hypothetical protein